MSKIIEVKKAVAQFLKENITCFNITVISAEKVKGVWHSVAEVYENDSFLKSMDMPPKQVRLFYSVHLDENLEIISFERVLSYQGHEEKEAA